MAKQGQRQPSPTSKQSEERQNQVAKGGSTRVGRPTSNRSGSDSNKGKKD